MKVLQINIFGNLSTGRIVVDLYRTLVENGYEGKVAFARNSIAEDVPYFKIGNMANVFIDGILTRLTDKAGFYSKVVTKKLIKKIVEYNPDIIHLHNLHGYYINIEILFKYLKECGKPVVWTLHDCWAFTGHCCYYTMVQCEKWITGCCACPQKKAYPASILRDNSIWNYQKKKELFTSVKKMQLVTVSKWLEGEVKKSFLKDIPCTTIYNGIDLNVFKPTKSDFREKYNLEDKFIILGVASTWDKRKGLDDFIRLSRMLEDDYRIVLIGVNNKEKQKFTKNMIGISRIDNIETLAGLYTTADVFFNASVEETFGLPTVEAMACGTPVIVYNCTALPEVVNEEVGFIIEPHNLGAVVKILKTRPKKIDALLAQKYSKTVCYAHYIDLYKTLITHDD